MTARGGATSLAAVVGRGMGRPCVAGCAGLHIDYGVGVMSILGADVSVFATIMQGEPLTIAGSSGGPARNGCV